MARNRTRERMRRLLDEWRRSGRSKSAFARAHGVSRSKFEYWQRHLDGAVRDGGRRGGGASLIPVQVRGGSIEDSAPVEIVLGSGDRVRLRTEMSEEILRLVVGVLRQGC
jgi:hypothetical protein